MSTGVGVNVLRWAALGFGIFYGIERQITISSSAKSNAAKREYENREQLISQAKQEFQKKQQPQHQRSSGVINDPEDPKFDLEQWIKAQEKSTA